MASVGMITANLVANTTRFQRPMEQAGKQLESFNKRAETVTKRLESVSRAGRVAGLALGALTGAIALGARNAARYGDEIDKMSIRTGIAREELQEMRHVAQQVGFEFDQLQQLTSTLGERLVDSEGKAGDMADIINRLGINLRDSQGNIRSMTELFDDTVLSLSRMENEVERNALAMRLLGEEGRKIIPWLEAGQDEIERMRREARDLGLVMSDTAIRDLAEFNTEMQVVASRASAAGRDLLMLFLPAIRVVLEWVNKAISWFGDLSDEQKENIVKWTALTVGVLGLVTTFGLFAKMGAVVLKWITILGGAISFLTAPWVVGLALLAGAVWLVWMAWDQNWLGIGDVIDKFVELVSAGLSALYDLLLQTELGQEIDRIFKEIKAVWDAEDLELAEKIVQIAEIILDVIDWKWLLAGTVIAVLLGKSLVGILTAIPLAAIKLAIGAISSVIGLGGASLAGLVGGALTLALKGLAIAATGLLIAAAIAEVLLPDDEKAAYYARIREIIEDKELHIVVKIGKISLEILRGAAMGIHHEVDKVFEPIRKALEAPDAAFRRTVLEDPGAAAAAMREQLEGRELALEAAPSPGFWSRITDWARDLAGRGGRIDDWAPDPDVMRSYDEYSRSVSDAVQEADNIVQVIGDVSGEFGWLGDRLGAVDVDLTDFMLTLGIMESNMENVGSAVSSAAGEFQLLASTRANIEAMRGAVDWTDPIERTRAAFSWLETGVKTEFAAIERHAKALEISLFDALQLWWVVGGPRLGEMGALGPAGLQLEATLGRTAEEILGRVPGARGRASGLQLGLQRGGILSGFGGSDSIPALLAPGEAVIPGKIWRQGIGAIAAWFKAAGVPGFQEGGIAGGGGLLGLLLPDLSKSIEEQGGIVSAMGSFIGDIPQMMAEGLVEGLGGLIDVMGMLAETVFGAEEAARVTLGLESFRDQIMKMLIALGFFEGEVDEAAEAVKQAAKEQEEAAKIAAIPIRGLAEAMEFLLGNIRQSMPLLNRAIDLFTQATADEIDEMGNVVQFGMNPLLALGLVVADVVMQSETFQQIMSIVNSILQAFADALGMVLEPLLPLVQILSQTVMPLLSMFGTILSALLVPVLQLLFPILKGFGVVILTLSQVIGRVWNTLLDLISLIPFVNLRRYKIDVDSLSEATQDLISLTWDEAMARSRNTEALEESTRVMVGVPSIFRIALRRAQAGSVGGPIPAMQYGGIVRRPTLALLGESGPEMVTPLSEGRTGGPVEITVNFNGPIFGMRDFQRAIEEAMGRAARSAGLAEHGVVVKFT